MWDVCTDPCPNFNSSLVNSPLKSITFPHCCVLLWFDFSRFTHKIQVYFTGTVWMLIVPAPKKQLWTRQNSTQSIRNMSPDICNHHDDVPDSKVYGANMGPIWGRLDPGGPHVDPIKFAIWGKLLITCLWVSDTSWCSYCCLLNVSHLKQINFIQSHLNVMAYPHMI